MEFNYFDLIVCIIILLLGLKGIINGFFKELFGLVGIIGGIFVASRVGDSVGAYLSDALFKFDNQSAISFTGFLATLAIFWVFMIFLGMVFKKLSSLSGLGAVDKILGFFFGVSKFFFIAAVIVHAMYNINAIRSHLDDMMKNSFMFPIMDEVGGFIMKLDPVKVEDKITQAIEENKEAIQSGIQTSLIDAANERSKDLQNQIIEKLSDTNQSLSGQKKEE
ncbi:MAG: CvpA family protein [Sulfurimonadaceae bacterium]|jgi:membrane protein required for colicin V production|nr:CvpA family protein [Sulfurimonadaceae bacterium]